MEPEQLSDTQKRIGISIAVPPPFSHDLTAARQSFGDPLAHAIPPHITLLGPTVVEIDQLAVISDHTARAAAATMPFRIHLRGAATFRPISPVVFVQVVQGLSQCEALERAVRSGPLDHPTRFNYHPHVTVAHEVSEANLDRAFEEMANYSAQFQVNKIHLFEHGADSVWRAVKSFTLGSICDSTETHP